MIVCLDGLSTYNHRDGTKPVDQRRNSIGGVGGPTVEITGGSLAFCTSVFQQSSGGFSAEWTVVRQQSTGDSAFNPASFHL